MAQQNLDPVPNVPILDDPTKDAILKRWFAQLFQRIATTGQIDHNTLLNLNIGDFQHLTASRNTILNGVQNANMMLAGPVAGAAAISVFRALVTADIPAGSIIAKIAAIALGGNRVVVLDVNEAAIYADNTNLTHADKILGITTSAASLGASVTIQTYGEMTEPSFNWTLDTQVFVSVNGLMTQTPPVTGFKRSIGFPIAATKLFINLQEPVIRS